MPLPKSKYAKKGTFRAQKTFTDREAPRAVFEKSILSWDERPLEVVVYYGDGGMGKTALLKNLRKDAQRVYDKIPALNAHSISIDLNPCERYNPVDIMLSIRSGVMGDCGLFDYAFLQYCSKVRLSVEEIKQRHERLSSPVLEMLDEALGVVTCSVGIPSTILRKGVDLVKDRVFKARHKEEIEELAQLDETEIFERLPHYLGLCLAFAAEHGNHHVLFLDGYESLLARTERGGMFSVRQEEWIRELIASAEDIRVFIGSRDKLRWVQDDPDWADCLQQHLLDTLSDEDSRWFLDQIPVRDEAVKDLIVANARGVPLYLDMCVDIYADDVNAGRDFCLAQEEVGGKIVERYLRHLPEREQDVVRTLAVPRSFDVEFALALLQRCELPYGRPELEHLLERSIFLVLDERQGLYKVDESVRQHLHASIDERLGRELLAAVLKCTLDLGEGRYFPQLAMVIECACSAPDMLDDLLQDCVHAVERYANSGFWMELHELLAAQVDAADARLEALAVIEELVYMRRVGHLTDADALAAAHPLDEELLGVWRYLYRFVKLQIRHLLGHYDESFEGYRNMVAEMDLVRTRIPDHVYLQPSSKYADLLFLRGDFEASLELVDKLLGMPDLDPIDEVELMRIKGHTFLFRDMFAEASIIYRSALDDVAVKNGLPGCIGKLYTNMAEALCTIAPEEALEWYEKARELHKAADNGVELGKAQAAASAAHTKLGELAEGRQLAEQAVATAQETGYRSGEGFGLVVLHYALGEAGDVEGAQRAREQLETIIRETGVYTYLLEKVASR